MTAEVLAAAAMPRDARTGEIIAALNADFLALLGWDWDVRVITFPRDHLMLGHPDCAVPGCGRVSRQGRLCTACCRDWRATGRSVEDFLTTASRRTRALDMGTCQLPGCGRPWKTRPSGLCVNHDYQRTHILKVSMAEFLAHPLAVPLPVFGLCAVAACARQRVRPGSAYCGAHQARLALERRNGTFTGDEDAWRLSATPVRNGREVSLRGIAARAVAEILFGLQARTNRGARTRAQHLRPLCTVLRSTQAGSLTELGTAEVAALSHDVAAVTRTMRTFVDRLGTTPESESRKDVWDLAAFGYEGTLNFTRIHQTCLRQAVKIWAYDDLPRRRGGKAGASVQSKINAVAALSESLRLQRADRGENPSCWGREDIVGFGNRLVFQMHSGTVSAVFRLTTVRGVRQVLARVRALGLTKPGQVLAGLPADFAFAPEDIPDEPEDAEAGKDLPDEVMRQLCDNLDLLEQIANREIRVAVELLIDTGRRPAEICRLAWDCLVKDPDGQLALRYDNHKAHRLGRRLPIAQATAAVIIEQQEHVRRRFPDTPVSELKLLPARWANPTGTRAIAAVNDPHRDWLDALPDFLIPVELASGGRIETKMLPFDKAKVFPYAYRHTYAQRHADAGVPIDVLAALMDHRELATTQAYYRVGQERRREAVNRVTALQFDRNGTRVWRKAQSLLDSEHVRRAIGEVATAYGVCLEPSNVAAGGQACPIRYRCVGCDHFRTDVSYLPDLQRYLDDLLRSRERLMSAFAADDWARSEATPSEAEIRRVRRLIARVKADLDDLDDAERAQIHEAIALVRRGRSVALGMPKVRQPLPDARPWSTP